MGLTALKFAGSMVKVSKFLASKQLQLSYYYYYYRREVRSR